MKKIKRCLIYFVVLTLIFSATYIPTTNAKYTNVATYSFYVSSDTQAVNTYNNVTTHTFIVPSTGIYALQVWGGGGGKMCAPWTLVVISVCADHADTVSNGGYIAGQIELIKGDILLISIGGRGKSAAENPQGQGGHNGGGNGSGGNFSSNLGGGGGGATDIRLNGSSLSHRIIVAGGGGGGGGIGATANFRYKGGDGGSSVCEECLPFVNGYAGEDGGNSPGTAGTTTGWEQGIGETNYAWNSGSGGGGAGYYGGATAANGGGGGGSSARLLSTTPINPLYTSYMNTPTVDEHDGKAIITYLDPL
jgi:hypothetical protein